MPGPYTRESVERVKEAVDMVELVSARTELRQVGARYTGLCPFHSERTPSFSVNAEHKLYYCFGCGASGDALGFVQQTEGLEFQQALEQLAERYGVALEAQHADPAAARRHERRERLLGLLKRAADYYARYLESSPQAEPARTYLSERGLGTEVLKRFRVGFAPNARATVLAAARAEGFTDEEIVSAGLAQHTRRGQLIDRFRGRIVFPLTDARGRALGFGARAVSADQQPKYINSAENEIYHKGRQVFGIDQARAAATKAARIVVVEGYTDVLALHQAGLSEVVGVMGTSVTQEQVAELYRVAPLCYLALDADSAGQSAMLRAASLAAERGMELRVVSLPEGTDPADLVASEGASGFAGRLDSALSVAEFEVRRVLANSRLDHPQGRDQALSQIRPLIQRVSKNSVTRDELVRYVADRLNVPAEYVMVQTSVTQSAGRPQSEQAPARPRTSRDASSADATTRAERAFLAMCLSQGEVGRRYLGRITDDQLSSQGLCRVRDWLLTNYDDPLARLPGDDSEFAASVTEVVMRADSEPSSQQGLELSFLQLELRRLERALRRAERSEDFERQRSLWEERERVRGRLAEEMGRTQ